MRNKLLALCLVVSAFGAGEAFASRATTAVFGTNNPYNVVGARGSLYYNDDQNIFYNPSYVFDYKNYVRAQKNNGTGTAAQAEGGVFSDMAGFVAGVYFNRGDAFSGYTNAAGTNLYTDQANLRPIDLFLAGDHGMKWGVGLTFANYKAETSTNGGVLRTTTDLGAKVGLQVADFEPFLHYKIMAKEKHQPKGATSGSSKGSAKDWALGTKYKYGEWTPYAAIRRYEIRRIADTEANIVKNTVMAIGAGRVMKATEGVKINYGFGYHRQKAKGRALTHQIPLDIGAEAEATSWMSLRGGVNYVVMNRTNGFSNASNTLGRFGAAFKFGKVEMDWAVGNTAGTEALDGSTFDLSNGLFSTASLTYKF